MKPMNQWRPISTAPRDRAVSLWVIRKKHAGVYVFFGARRVIRDGHVMEGCSWDGKRWVNGGGPVEWKSRPECPEGPQTSVATHWRPR